MKKYTTFDTSLADFVEFLENQIGDRIVEKSLFLRDATGRLTCIVDEEDISACEREKLSLDAADLLAPYIEGDGFAVCIAEELFDDELKNPTLGIVSKIKVGEKKLSIRLLDRRVMGGAWLQNQKNISIGKRLVFASLKGGVGRSTALCVLASELAKSGQRVLAIDMDVEAPGIGSMLLSEETVPKYGLLDYLVESGIQNITDELLNNLSSPSWLADGQGIVSVIPAIGKESLQNPKNVLSKIARAYLNGKNEEAIGITRKMQNLLDELEERNEYDIILLDARAGMHETTGSALLGLGGRIALFGTDQKQTVEGFKILFSNLSMVENDGWQDRLIIVQSKASANSLKQKTFQQKIQESFADVFLEQEVDLSLSSMASDLNALENVFEIEWEDNIATVKKRTENLIYKENGLVEVCAILESEGYRDFDPISNPDILSQSTYNSIYGDFISQVKLLMDLN